MIEVSRAYFRFDIEAPAETALTRFATEVFAEFDEAAARVLPLPDYALYVGAEQGSLRGGGKIMAGGGLVYTAIAQFGGFVQGVREIKNLGEYAGEQLISAAERQPETYGRRADWKRRDAGTASRVERLFEKVQRGELTPEEATHAAVALLEGEASLPAGAAQEIDDAFHEIELHPEQFEFGLDDERLPPRPQRSPHPKTPYMPTRLVVEIERETRASEPRLRRRYR